MLEEVTTRLRVVNQSNTQVWQGVAVTATAQASGSEHAAR